MSVCVTCWAQQCVCAYLSGRKEAMEAVRFQHHQTGRLQMYTCNKHTGCQWHYTWQLWWKLHGWKSERLWTRKRINGLSANITPQTLVMGRSLDRSRWSKIKEDICIQHQRSSLNRDTSYQLVHIWWPPTLNMTIKLKFIHWRRGTISNILHHWMLNKNYLSFILI